LSFDGFIYFIAHGLTILLEMCFIHCCCISFVCQWVSSPLLV